MAYSLSTHYAGQALLDGFSFFTGKDPTNGFVKYLSREEATTNNLVSVDEYNRVKLGVDSINTYSVNGTGRASVRVTSNDHFTHGLFIADFAHMPSSTCGTWPAFWAFNTEGNGTFWPKGGEVDIIEGANTAQRNLFSAYTTSGCQAPRIGFTGVQGPTNCASSLHGCNYAAPTSDSATYGDAFNAQGGGVYALEWDVSDIKIWHFPRTAIPEDIMSAPLTTPDPTTWGQPHALFGGSGCEADSYFFKMSLAINTNFCGAYAGNAWGVTDQCDKLAPTCEEYVAKNPSSFNNAFWQINYIDVYEKPVQVNGTAIAPHTTSAIAATSTPSPNGTSSFAPSGNDVTPTRTRTVTLSTITRTVSTAEPTQTGGGLSDPATIDGRTLLGCFGSPKGYESFTQVSSFAAMDNEACVASCAGHKYAGISGETCYCADVLGNATAVANEMCDVPCTGTPRQFCGGILSADERTSSPSFAGMGIARTNSTPPSQDDLRLVRGSTPPGPRADPLSPHAAPPTALLTVYGDVGRDVPPGAPGMGVRRRPAGNAAVAVVTVTTTVTFTTICPTDAGRLIELEYATTLTAEQQQQQRGDGRVTAPAPAPTVPMTTYAGTCDACGPHSESTITFTVPCAFAAGRGGGHVMAIAVQTVVPVLANASLVKPGPTSPVPALVGAAATTTTAGGMAGFLQTVGYALALWFFVFAIGIIL